MADEWGMDEAYDMLMSPLPYMQASAAQMIRNFGTAAQLMAQSLRQNAAGGEGAGDAGEAMRTQSESHAEWFDQVAANSAHAASRLDTLSGNGHQYQASASTVYHSYKQSIARDAKDPSGASDVHQIHMEQAGSRQLSGTVNDWSSDYSSFTAPKPPPVPTGDGGTYGSGGSGGSGGGGDTVPVSGGGAHQAQASGTGRQAVFVAPAGVVGTGKPRRPVDRGPGVTGSVEVGPDGGEFAGWYKDPRTGYYIDPKTGREYDPASQRWVDPVTGQPFGDVAKYATGLQGLGTESTTGGLLSDVGGAGVLGGAAAPGGAGAFAGLVGSGLAGDPAAVAVGYGGVLPPSLANGSAASSALWNQAGRSLGVNRAVASEMLGREQAARSGRPYMPSTQAQAGQGFGGARNRPGYVTAEDEESALFSSPAARRTGAAAAAEEGEELAAGRMAAGRGGANGRGGAAAAEEEQAAASAAGRRSYLPPSQAGSRSDKDDKRRDRPDWLVEDAFGVDDQPAGAGVLGE
ncbi:OCRE domain-containing protein [uncultured Jatrophihabitans sp.]|uniref:OCRE domain-containing protein n=1 Tax=uncultured Jatrophihabitans sp. TaxID=1610747 RepID=UPI0035CA99E3